MWNSLYINILARYKNFIPAGRTLRTQASEYERNTTRCRRSELDRLTTLRITKTLHFESLLSASVIQTFMEIRQIGKRNIQQEAREACYDFDKIFSIILVSIIYLLIGIYFRKVPIFKCLHSFTTDQFPFVVFFFDQLFSSEFRKFWRFVTMTLFQSRH